MVEDDGCLCIFIPGKKKQPPLIVQKSDGGFNYDSTDMAALEHRFGTLAMDKVIVITDKGQEQHFKQVFTAGDMTKLIGEH